MVVGVTILRDEISAMQASTTIRLNLIPVAEYAAYQRAIGERVSLVKGVYWRQVRPFFFRPLLPYREYPPGLARVPLFAHLGGAQHAVPDTTRANSSINLRIFDDPSKYSIDSLDKRFQRQVKLAQHHFSIRPIDDLNEFKQKAFPVYRSFYERTRYEWGAERNDPHGFSCWADKVFRLPGMIILGGYRGQSLGGISLSQFIEGTLIYATFFCDSESLRLNLSGLMLHAVREAAANNRDVEQIYIGMGKKEKGLDDFYLLRGCKMIRKPTFLYLNPFARVLLKWSMTKKYSQIWGHGTS